jgi:hypothetical protein
LGSRPHLGFSRAARYRDTCRGLLSCRAKTATRNVARVMTPSDWRTSVVGEVAGEADGCLGHGPAPFCCLAGGLPCPWNRGTVNTEACQETPRGKPWSQRSRPYWINCRVGSAQGSGWLVGRLRLGSGMPAPSGQITSTLARLENEAPPRRPLTGPPEAPELVSAQSVLAVTRSDLLTIC